ncbi:outer membrane beta-barrel protein [candidate division KSB1 bacterium]
MKNLQKYYKICFGLLFILVISVTAHGQTRKFSVAVSAGLVNLPVKDFEEYYNSDLFPGTLEGFYNENPHLSRTLAVGYRHSEKQMIFIESEIIKARKYYSWHFFHDLHSRQWNIKGIPVTLGYQYKIRSIASLDLFIESGLSYIFTDIKARIKMLYRNVYAEDQGLDQLQTNTENIEVVKDNGFGGHVGAGIDLDISDKTFTFFRARYRYAPVMTIMSKRGDEVNFDFTGYYFNLGLGYSF